MSDKRIILKSSTLDALKVIKSKYAVSSYDMVISQLIANSLSVEKLDKLTHTNLLDEVKKLLDRNLKRIEASHTRLGAFEKNYFLKINDINDEISKLDLQLKNNEKKEIEPAKNVENNSNDSNLIYMQKLNLLKSKVMKSDDVFSTTYNIVLSEADYLKIFE